MSAAPDIISEVHAAGGRILMVEDRLKVRAPSPLANELVAELRRRKAEIMAFLQERKSTWTPGDWRTFFDERADIAEHDGDLPRAEAEVRAFECSVVEWMNQKPASSEPGRCAWCREPEGHGMGMVVPFATETHRHTWLHTHCWPAWQGRRREKAVRALAELGITPPTQWTG